MSDTQKATQNTQDLVMQLNDQVVSLGLVEKAQVKWRKSLVNTPVIKQLSQLKLWVGGITKAHRAREQQTEGEEDAQKKGQNNLTTLQALTTVMTSFGLASKVAGKGTTGLSKAFFGLASSILFIFGIFLVITLAVAAFAAVMADVNSPLAQMVADIPILGELFNGLKIILTGEDGESGVKGALDVLVVALVAGAAAWFLFGLPVAIVVATLVGVVGIFRWMKNKTGSWVAGLIAASTILLVGIVGFLFAIKASFATAVAWVLLPIALITAGITGMWLSLTGEISYWWGVISAIGVVIGAALLWCGGFIAFMTALPVIAVVAAGAALIFTIVYWWDEIVAFFVAAWDWLVDFGTGLWDGIVAGWNAFESWFRKILKAAIDIIFWVPKQVWKGILKLAGLWPKFKKKLKGIKDGVVNWFVGIGDWISKKWNSFMKALKAFPGRVKDVFMNGIRKIANGIGGVWNKYIAHKIPRIKIPDWVPGLGGKKWGPKPEKMKMFADGGIVTSPTLGMIGEAGAEAIIPLKGGAVPVHLKGAQYSDETLKRMVKGLAKVVKDSGNTYNININPSGLVIESEKARERFAKEVSKEIMSIIERETIGTLKSPLKTIGGWF